MRGEDLERLATAAAEIQQLAAAAKDRQIRGQPRADVFLAATEEPLELDVGLVLDRPRQALGAARAGDLEQRPQPAPALAAQVAVAVQLLVEPREERRGVVHRVVPAAVLDPLDALDPLLVRLEILEVLVAQTIDLAAQPLEPALDAVERFGQRPVIRDQLPLHLLEIAPDLVGHLLHRRHVLGRAGGGAARPVGRRPVVGQARERLFHVLLQAQVVGALPLPQVGLGGAHHRTQGLLEPGDRSAQPAPMTGECEGTIGLPDLAPFVEAPFTRAAVAVGRRLGRARFVLGVGHSSRRSGS